MSRVSISSIRRAHQLKPPTFGCRPTQLTQDPDADGAAVAVAHTSTPCAPHTAHIDTFKSWNFRGPVSLGRAAGWLSAPFTVSTHVTHERSTVGFCDLRPETAGAQLKADIDRYRRDPDRDTELGGAAQRCLALLDPEGRQLPFRAVLVLIWRARAPDGRRDRRRAGGASDF